MTGVQTCALPIFRSLEAEGLARDVIRVVQDTRKAAGLNVSDRISMTIRAESPADLASLAVFEATIAGDTLATQLALTLSDDPALDAATDSMVGSQRTVVIPDQYANTGVLVIDLWKAASVDV